jgi:hypothetical protein
MDLGEQKVIIENVIDSKTIEFSGEINNIDANGGIFVYGQIVDNFNQIRKNYIYTVAVAALQEVDRQLQAEKVKVSTLETQLADVLARLTQLEHTVSVLDSNMTN